MKKTQKSETSHENINPELLEMSLEKIREFIKILEEHEQKIESQQNFKEASKVKKRIQQLRFIEEEKVKSELRKMHNFQKNQLESERDQAFHNFETEYNNLQYELRKKFEDMQGALNSKHAMEYEESIREFNETFPENNPKLSAEILDLQKKLDHNVKIKDYDKAHELQMKIIELTNEHNKKWNEETKKWKLDSELLSIRTRQDSAFLGLKLKIEATMNEYLRKRKVEKEKLERMFENKMKELLNNQRIEMNELDGSGKNAAIKSDKYVKTKNTLNSLSKKKTIDSSYHNEMTKVRTYSDCEQIIEEK